MKPEHLKQLIHGKRQWSEPLTPEEQAEGFKGWYASKHLPHFDSRGAQQYLTEMRSTSGGLCAISRIIQSKRIWCRRPRIGHGAVRASGANWTELGVPLRIQQQGVCRSGWGDGRWLLLSGDEPSPPRGFGAVGRGLAMEQCALPERRGSNWESPYASDGRAFAGAVGVMAVGFYFPGTSRPRPGVQWGE